MKLGDYITLTDTDIEYRDNGIPTYQIQKILYYHSKGFHLRKIERATLIDINTVKRYLRKFKLKPNKLYKPRLKKGYKRHCEVCHELYTAFHGSAKYCPLHRGRFKGMYYLNGVLHHREPTN